MIFVLFWFNFLNKLLQLLLNDAENCFPKMAILMVCYFNGCNKCSYTMQATQIRIFFVNLHL